MFPENRVFKTLDNPKMTSFIRKSSPGPGVRVWKCCGKTKELNDCIFLNFSLSHLQGHVKRNHGDDDPLTLPEDVEVVKKTLTEDVEVVKKCLSKRPHVLKVLKGRRKPGSAMNHVGEKRPDQKWKYQDMYVRNGHSLDVHVYGGINEDFFYDESEKSQASTTDTTPNKNY